MNKKNIRRHCHCHIVALLILEPFIIITPSFRSHSLINSINIREETKTEKKNNLSDFYGTP